MDVRHDTERYRRAAEHALEQLDWCIAYLRRIRKVAEAQQLAENRAVIARKLRPPDADARAATQGAAG